MNLYFKSHEATFSLRHSHSAHDEEPVLDSKLIGLSEMHTDDDSTSPTSDMYSIDHDAAELMRRVPLLTFVHLIPAERWERFMTNRAYQTDWLGHESESEPPSVEAIASISYFEARSEFSQGHGGQALLSIELKISAKALSPTSAVFRGFQNPNLSVALDLDGIEFTTHERMREKWEIPTLGAFLKSESSAYAAGYDLTFSTNGPTNGFRSELVETDPFFDKSRFAMEKILRSWRL